MFRLFSAILTLLVCTNSFYSQTLDPNKKITRSDKDARLSNRNDSTSIGKKSKDINSKIAKIEQYKIIDLD